MRWSKFYISAIGYIFTKHSFSFKNIQIHYRIRLSIKYTGSGFFAKKLKEEEAWEQPTPPLKKEDRENLKERKTHIKNATPPLTDYTIIRYLFLGLMSFNYQF